MSKRFWKRNGKLTAVLSFVFSFSVVFFYACGREADPSALQRLADQVNGSNSSNVSDSSTTETTVEVVTCDTAGTPFGGGNGSSGEPYLICNATQLQSVETSLTSNFKLMANINLTGVSFTPISNFQGVFDGNGYKISNLKLDTIGSDSAFFVEIASGAEVRKLGIIDADIDVDFNSSRVAVLATRNLGTISECMVTGDLRDNSGAVAIMASMVARNEASGQIQNSYSAVALHSGHAMAGMVSQNFGTISNSYSTSEFSAWGYSEGGFVSAHSTNAALVTNSFWDSTLVLNVATSVGGTSRNTAQMQTATTFTGAGWSTSIWNIQNGSYPTLQWE